jgi:hypothetical protein
MRPAADARASCRTPQPPWIGVTQPDRATGETARVRSSVHAFAGFVQLYRVGAFVVGLLFVTLGLALVWVPGPVTIPPILLGLWIWSTEFAFAERLFQRVRLAGADACERARSHPVASALVTLGGLAAAGAAAWAIVHYELIDQARSATGI